MSDDRQAWVEEYLARLGFDVTLLVSRAIDRGSLGPPFHHMCLRVELDEPWLADGGFGDSFLHPLRLDSREDQIDPVGTFRLVPRYGGQLELLRDGDPRAGST